MATLKIKLMLKLEYHADRKHGILGPGAFVEEWKVFSSVGMSLKLGLGKTRAEVERDVRCSQCVCQGLVVPTGMIRHDVISTYCQSGAEHVRADEAGAHVSLASRAVVSHEV